MYKIYIDGLVSIARRVKHELTGPVSPDRLATLKAGVRVTLGEVDKILAGRGLTYKALPPPSRNAYQFLANIDFGSIHPSTDAGGGKRLPESVSLGGIQAGLDRAMDQLATGANNQAVQYAFTQIKDMSELIEQAVSNRKLKPEHLTARTRAIRGYLAYFAEPDNFDRYIEAVKLAVAVFDKTLRETGKSHHRAVVRFYPLKALYSLRSSRNGIRIKLSAPMICFDQATFQALADMAIRKARNRLQISNAVCSKEYQAVQSEMELLGGVFEQTAGLHHDLAESFARVNTLYFSNGLSQPRLTWSRTFSSRKLGHYDHACNTVMISSTLDKKEIPSYVIDYIMYHELLHQALGYQSNGSTRTSHSPQFRRRERLFQQYDQAKRILGKQV